MDEPTKQTVRELVVNEPTFVRLTLNTRPALDDRQAWRQVVVRPVEIRGRRHLQFSYFDAKRDVTKNYHGAEAERQLELILDLPSRSLSVQSKGHTLNVQVTRSGKAILHRGPPAPAATAPDLHHNRRKALPLAADRPDPFLQALGIMDAQGRVRPPMQGKFTQVNEFLKLLEHTGELTAPPQRPLRIVDCASGSSHLTLATYHYLNHVRHIPATLLGIDVDAALVAKSQALARELGFHQAQFHASTIVDFEPPEPPDIVLSLHACDTATDEALAKGITWGARLILSVPCCHHHLHTQLQPAQPFGPVLQHGILKTRLADILTDALRAQLLRLAGYETDVIEFVSTEHSGRNLMIRAVKRRERGAPALAQEYEALKGFWGVTPHLESLLNVRSPHPRRGDGENLLVAEREKG
jgi:hypothetical protein